MDMMEVLARARQAIEGSPRFDARRVFGERKGKQIVFPVGLGSALAKAVREGYLRVVSEDGGSRRRGRKYEFTRKGLEQSNAAPTPARRGGHAGGNAA